MGMPSAARKSDAGDGNPADEIQHSKPGEDSPLIAHSGLVKTHGLQIGISERCRTVCRQPHPGRHRLGPRALLDPATNIELLVGKIRRLKQELGFPEEYVLMSSRSYLEAKAIATLTYLHNGKLDHPARSCATCRILSDGLIYGDQSRGSLGWCRGRLLAQLPVPTVLELVPDCDRQAGLAEVLGTASVERRPSRPL